MTTPLILGVGVAAAALGARYAIRAVEAFLLKPRVRRFYEGGFQHTMTRREAALILGLRESELAERVKEQHRKVMMANHPDAGGSAYLATKINEARDVLEGKKKPSGPSF